MKTVLAGDLGGTKCRFALVAEDFRVHGVERVRTTPDRAAFLAELQQKLAAILAARPRELQPPAAIGMGTAGVIAADGGRIVRAPNLPLDDFPLAEHLLATFGCKATLLNDGRASA